MQRDPRLPARPLHGAERHNFDALLLRLADEFGRVVRVSTSGLPPRARFVGTLTSIERLTPSNEFEAKLGEIVFVKVEPDTPSPDSPPVSYSQDRGWGLGPDDTGFALRRDTFKEATQIGGDSRDNPTFLSIEDGHYHYTVTLSPRR